MYKVVINVIGVEDEKFGKEAYKALTAVWSESAYHSFTINSQHIWIDNYCICCSDLDVARYVKRYANSLLNDIFDKMLDEDSFLRNIEYETRLKIIQVGKQPAFFIWSQVFLTTVSTHYK